MAKQSRALSNRGREAGSPSREPLTQTRALDHGSRSVLRRHGSQARASSRLCQEVRRFPTLLSLFDQAAHPGLASYGAQVLDCPVHVRAAP